MYNIPFRIYNKSILSAILATFSAAELLNMSEIRLGGFGYMPVNKGAKSRIRRSKRYSPNGQRECARRMRQIEAGQLTRSNGLVA